MLKLSTEEIFFAKMNDSVISPTKREEDGGYDIYANFEEDYIVINPHTTVLIPTRLKSAFSSKYRIILAERGSTGSKGIAQRCGVIDSGYRGEWFVPLTNTTDIPILIIKKDALYRMESIKKSLKTYEMICYPYEKAICQALVEEVPRVNFTEISEEQLVLIKSERGTGKLGSSSK